MDRDAAAKIVADFATVHDQYVGFAKALDELLSSIAVSLVPSAQVSGRAKDVESLRLKLEDKDYESMSDVPDLAGVRVIVQTLSDVEAVVTLMQTEFDVIEDVKHDNQHHPDSFGYASRHLVLELSDRRRDLPEWARFTGMRAEVQVRTILQHAWASISHTLDYKSNADVPADVRRKLFQVAALIEVGDGLFEDFANEQKVVKQSYDDQASHGDWRDLPINLDSLHSSWHQWEPKWVSELVPEAANIFVIDDEEVAARWNIAYPNPAFLSEIVTICGLLDITTVGAFADLLELEGRDRIGEYLEFRVDHAIAGGVTVDFLVLVFMIGQVTVRGFVKPEHLEYIMLPSTWEED